MYIIVTIFSAILIYLSYGSGSVVGIDTLITEFNCTFREVVGGYIIKSAIENAVKIGGNYYVGISNAKLKMLQSKLKEKYPDITDEEESVTEDDEYIVEEDQMG